MYNNNSHWTEWSTIQGVIVRVISKSDERDKQAHKEPITIKNFVIDTITTVIMSPVTYFQTNTLV